MRLRRLLSSAARHAFGRFPRLIVVALMFAPLIVAFGEAGRKLLSFLQLPARTLKRRPVTSRPPRSLLWIANWIAAGKVNDKRTSHVLERFLSAVAHYYFAAGQLALAQICFESLRQLIPGNSLAAVTNLRHLGTVLFLQGHIPRANEVYRDAGRARRVVMASRRITDRFRVLGTTWFVAIGHVAMLDFYLKKRMLSWGAPAQKLVVLNSFADIQGGVLASEFGKKGIDFIGPASLEKYYTLHKAPDDLDWHSLSISEKDALIDEFWEYDFPDGDILTYTHGAARVQQEWEARGLKSLLSLSPEQQVALQTLREQLGIPRDAWFVCLHVREAGFHAKWNKLYPTARDAVIDDYANTIHAIVKRGGWVLRMGDTSMKRLPRRPNVIDYAHSPYKCEIADILLAAGCKFFIGTNSGYATIPAIYGVPCVFTNWIPIALPLWFSQDLMIPKLFWHSGRGSRLSFEEIFGTRLGATQNMQDFPAEIDILDNSPQDIEDVVSEMFDQLESGVHCSKAQQDRQERYFEIALHHGSYKGSRIGKRFLEKNEDLLWANASAEMASIVPVADTRCQPETV